jgi:multiple sugar transport system ATP-binding protein
VDIFTARFIGTPEMNMIDATIDGEQVDLGANATSVDVSKFAGLPPDIGSGRSIVLGVRPQELNLLNGGRDDFPIRIEGKVRVAEPHGSETFVLIDLPVGHVVARAPSTIAFKPGDAVAFGAEAGCLRIFDKQTERLIS